MAIRQVFGNSSLMLRRRRSAFRNPHSAIRNRKGVILLVAMALLALFSVVVLTFVIVARQHKQAADALIKAKFYDDNYEEHLTQAALQIIRGTDNPLSVLGPHSLLEDLYGPRTLFGTIGDLTVPIPNGPLYSFPLTLDAASPAAVAFNDYYNGCVITLRDASGQGASFRIVDYATGSNTVTVINTTSYSPHGQDPYTDSNMNGNWDTGETYTDDNGDGRWTPGEEFVINGRQFSGQGFGVDPDTFGAAEPFTDSNGNGTWDPMEPYADIDADGRWDSITSLINYPKEWFIDTNGNGTWNMMEPFGDKNGNGTWDQLNELALRPNPRSTDWRRYLTDVAIHANEDYDAPDYQNMILAMRLADTTATGSIRIPIPSLHRPDLIQYWIDRQGVANFNALPLALKREILLRPLTNDNTTAWASVNPGFDPLDPDTWDVDNDGDGIKDSIWVDLGMPVQTAPDGRQYKPLFAIMCIDMDGKLNINVHGQLNDWNNEAAEAGGTFHTNPQVHSTVFDRPANAVDMTMVFPELAGTLNTSMMTPTGMNARLPAGLGYGPQEVNISTSIRNADILVDDVQFRQLLRGVPSGTGSGPVEGRYGEGHLIVADSTTAAPILAGQTGQDDNRPAPVANLNGSPPDFDGNGVMGLSPTGHPYYYYMTPHTNGINNLAETMDEASELDPTGRRRYVSTAPNRLANVDNAFTAAELETILRANDLDSSQLPQRILELAPALSASYNRARMTTESWDIPCPNFVPTPEIAGGLSRLRSLGAPIQFGNLGIVDLIRGKLKAADPSLSLAQVNARTNQLLGADVIAPELLAGTRINLNRQFGASSNDPAEKARLARHLYFSMLLLKDSNYAISRPSGAGDTGVPDASMMSNFTLRQELTSQQIAQWAINVVDFRDSDATMTPFEYVIDPFNADGWNINNSISTDESAAGGVNADRRVVWGHEDSGLLITETKAFHDVRLRDTDQEAPMGTTTTAAMMADTDYDSVRIPEGSLFVELFCTANPSVGNAANKQVDMRGYLPTELYNNGRLELGKMSAGGMGTNPVWRLAISEIHSAATSPVVRTLMQQGGERDLTGSLEPVPYPYEHQDPVPASMRAAFALPAANTQPPGWQSFSLLKNPDTAVNEIKIERVVWFGTTPPAGAAGTSINDKDNIYYNQVSNPLVSPGQYAVVGPYRSSTGPWWAPGSNPAPAGAPNMTAMGTATGSAPPTITLNTTSNNVTATTNPPLAAMSNPYDITKIRDAVPIPCAGIRPTSNSDFYQHPVTMMYERAPSTFSWIIGLSVSEPLFSSDKYYYLPTDDLTPTQHSTTPATVVYDRYKTPPDQPEDVRVNSPANQVGLTRETVDDFRTVFLQRLADPTVEWNAITNPYITIDWMPIDLTVFNGEATQTKPSDTNPDITFSSRERGQVQSSEGTYNLYSQRYDDSHSTRRQSMAAPQVNGSFYYNLDHSFAYVNEPFHDTGAMAGDPWLYGTNDYNDANLKGFPVKPFPWVTWNNRPYASQFESMNVPATRSSRLFWDFNMVNTPGGYPYDEEFYKERTTAAMTISSRPSAPYGHLLNFFFSADKDSDPGYENGDTNNPNLASPVEKAGAVANYYRIFDYVHVPSRYSGSELALNPSDFTPPNDRFSTYREPGRVNINTISDRQELTWLGITNSFNSDSVISSNATATWSNLTQSANRTVTAEPYTDANMNGIYDSGEMYTDTNGNGFWDNWFYNAHTDYPTVSPNLFRSFGNAGYLPLARLRGDREPFNDMDMDGIYNAMAGDTFTDLDGDGTWDSGFSSNEFIDGTLFRRLPSATNPPSTQPLLAFHSNSGTYDATGFMYSGAFNDSDRNAYFRNLMYQKLGNVLTTRSNVYAVWITVGYFDVSRSTDFAASPDGYSLGGELGSDTGEIKRHKSFFLLDRSIPVAFERGKNYNVHRAILLHKIVE